ncbi:MAG: hypothetical protein D6803_02670 [Anaerolineae bacterium]|nr:MAG: hypothetical protein D6803_02670 [Anaerolineae bacterium]
MDAAFLYNRYLLKRQTLALTGKFRIYAPDGRLVLYSQQKMFRLREDIRVFADESMTRELLHIQARQIIDFAAAYDVFDTQTGQKVGTLRRKGFRSLVRDAWEILDAQDQPLGVIREDSMTLALLRRFLLGSLLPQNYDVLINQQRVADLKQRFRLIGYHLDIDFTMDTAGLLDHRLGIAAAILLAAIEGKQAS